MTSGAGHVVNVLDGKARWNLVTKVTFINETCQCHSSKAKFSINNIPFSSPSIGPTLFKFTETNNILNDKQFLKQVFGKDILLQ